MSDSLKIPGLGTANAGLLGALPERAIPLKNGEFKAKINDPEEAKAAAEQFESLLLHQMFSSMWQNVPSEGMLSGSKEEEMYRDMLNQALADSISKEQSIGIKEVLLRELDPEEKK